MSASPSRLLSRHCGGDWAVRPLSGAGSAFCDTWHARPRSAAGASTGELFVKSLPASRAEVLHAEADGLAALAAVRSIRVPAVAGCWTDADVGLAVLAIEWLDLTPAPAADFGEQLGRQLAALHLAAPTEGGGRFGWRRDNWLGGTPQRNRWSEQDGREGWLAFFARERLGAVAEHLSAADAGRPWKAVIAQVTAALPRFFDDGHQPRPALVHGDLWSGNWGSLQGGVPVLYDPAVSVSDAEAELAMMELFGAPPRGFFPAYRELAGLAPGYERRRGLYQLYHLLNHALLFGGGYAGQALGLAQRLLGG
jgi:fructosamine-3-kinase